MKLNPEVFVANGVKVNIGVSKSILSVSGDGVNYNSTISANVTANNPANIYARSERKAAGAGYQSGNVVARFSYN
ncbi:hypothetical protein RJK31_004428 [Salmonella enterica]|nr:hypothetical protein [Salmonella enterica]ELC4947005.1 hypothetical protein [Salmonella enterica]